MSEYASPFSIALCKLIALNADPESELSKHFLASSSQQNYSKLSWLLQQYIFFPENTLNNNNNNDYFGAASTSASELYSSSYQHIPLCKLLHQLKTVVCSSSSDDDEVDEIITHQFVEELTQISESIDSMMDFFTELKFLIIGRKKRRYKRDYQNNNQDPQQQDEEESLDSNDEQLEEEEKLNQGTVDGKSAIGIYVRKISIGLESLSFEEVAHLWTSFHEYIHEYNNNNNNNNSNTEKKQKKNDWILSSRQMESIIKQKCQDFDSMSSSLSASKSQMDLQLDIMMAQHSELPAIHFLQLLNNIRHNEHVGAMDALHRYFDYAMIHDRRELLNMIQQRNHSFGNHNRNSSSDDTQTPNNNNNQSSSQIMTTTNMTIQYAALLLASLHYEFGNNFLALKATEEAIRVAQQNGDAACVAYALGWLPFLVSSSSSDTNNSSASMSELFDKFKQIALDLNLTSLASCAHLATTKHSVRMNASSNGNDTRGTRRVSPRDIWQSLESSFTSIRSNNIDTGAAGSSMTNQRMMMMGGGGAMFGATSSHQIDGAIQIGNSNSYMRHLPTNSNSINNNNPNNNNTSSSSSSSALPSNVHENINGPPTISDSMNLLSRQNLMASAIWESYGFTMNSLTTACCAASSIISSQKEGDEFSMTALEYVMAAQKMVLNGCLYGNNVNSLLYSSSSSQTTTNSSVYDDARMKLIDLRQKYHNNNNHINSSSEFPIVDYIWSHTTNIIAHEQSIHQNKLVFSKTLQHLIQSNIPPLQHFHVESTLQTLETLIHSLNASGECKKAMRLTQTCIKLSQIHGLSNFQCRFLCHLAILHLSSSSSSSNNNSSSTKKNPIPALAPLLECLSLTTSNKSSHPQPKTLHDMDPIHAIAISLLAQVYFRLSQIQKSASLIKGCLPLLKQHAPLIFQGDAWLTLAKCSMKQASRSTSTATTTTTSSCSSASQQQRNTSSKSLTFLKLAIDQIHKSISIYEKIQNINRLCEAYYLLVRLYQFFLQVEEEQRDQKKEMMMIKKKTILMLKSKRDKAIQVYHQMRRQSVLNSTEYVWQDALLSLSSFQAPRQ